MRLRWSRDSCFHFCRQRNRHTTANEITNNKKQNKEKKRTEILLENVLFKPKHTRRIKLWLIPTITSRWVRNKPTRKGQSHLSGENASGKLERSRSVTCSNEHLCNTWENFSPGTPTPVITMSSSTSILSTL